MSKYLIILFFAIISINAQVRVKHNASLSGIVIDSISLEKIPLASVTIFSKNVYIKTAISDSNGYFVFSDLNNRSYKIQINMTGYHEVIIDSIETTAGRGKNLGIIQLVPSTLLLQGVNITAKRPLFEHYEDKDVVNVEQMPGQETSTIIDILKRTPLIKVDKDNNISILGRSEVNILVDGNPMIGDGNTLSMMAAATVEKIEVISNPSSKYDAEGDTGIINIISKKLTQDDFNAKLTGNASNDGKYSTSIISNLKKNKINLYGYYSFSHKTGDYNDKSIDQSVLNSLAYDSHTTNKFSSNLLKLGADYTQDPFNNYSVTLAILPVQRKRSTLGDFNSVSSLSSGSRFLVDEYKYSSDYSSQLSSSYKHKFADNGNKLTSDILLSWSGYGDTKKLIQSNYFPDISTATTNVLNNTINRLLIFKVDYAYPDSIFGKLQVGYRGTFRNRSINYEVDNYNIITTNWDNNLSFSNKFSYMENINAAYIIYSNNINSINYQFGLRSEYTSNKGIQETSDSTFRNNYLDLLPSFFIKEQFNKSHSLRFSYSKRLMRPYLEALNPFKEFYTAYGYATGNANLKPSYSTVYDLTYNYIFENGDIMVKGYYSKETGMLSTATVLESDSIYKITWLNLAKVISRGAALNVNLTIMESLTTSASIEFDYKDFYASYEQENLSHVEQYWSINLSLDYDLYKGYKISFTGSYVPAVRNTLFSLNESINTSIVLQKKFFDEKLNIALSLNNVENYNYWEYYNYGSDFSNHMKSIDNKNRNVTLGFTYNINSFILREERNIDDGRDKR